MRFHYGPVPETTDFQPDQGDWQSIRAPGPNAMQLVAFPIGLMICVVVGGISLFCLPPGLTLDDRESVELFLLLPFLATIIFLVPIHELIHALFHPACGLSDKTIIGLWLSKGLFYAYYEGSMTRNRFLMVYAGPFIVLSLLPLGILALLRSLSVTTAWSIGFALLSLLGGVIAAGDFVAFMAMIRIPSSATVRSKGWKTYWRSMTTT